MNKIKTKYFSCWAIPNKDVIQDRCQVISVYNMEQTITKIKAFPHTTDRQKYQLDRHVRFMLNRHLIIHVTSPVWSTLGLNI